MKNIHILPTDKPSKLRYFGGKLERIFAIPKESDIVFQNIYITSDEEIKEGVNQWYLDKFLNKPRNSSGSQYGEKQDVIILTTDQDLIKDGVQEIPEYFLIHYIVGNNPIEYVEIKEHLESIDTMKINYELIIPKEELSTKLHKGEIVDESYPKEFKQETLEDIKLEEVVGSKHCLYSVIENKLSVLYRNQEQILKAIKMLNNGR